MQITWKAKRGCLVTISLDDAQITAEQILREAQVLQDKDFKAPKQVITDPEELAEYRLRKRKEFEDTVRRVGAWNPGAWVKVGGCA